MTHTPRLLAVAAVLLLTAGGSRVVAQGDEGAVRVGITPSVVTVVETEGGALRQRLTASNEGEETFTLSAGVIPMDGASEESSAVGWLSVDPPRIELEPGDTEAVTVDVEVPPGIPSGGYYAVVTVTTEARVVDGADAAVTGQLGVPFLITVDGADEVIVEAEVERFAAVLERDGRTGFRAQVRNTGNTHVVLRGEIAFGEADGEADGDAAFREPTLVLAGGSALLDGPVPLLLESGQRYRATAEIDYGLRDPLAAETEFTAVPPDLELAALAVCATPDQGIAVQLEIDNVSNLGVLPSATFTVGAADGSIDGEPVVVDLPVAWPNELSAYSIGAAGELADGAYDLTMTVTGGPASRETGAVSFEIGGDGPDVLEPCP